MRIYEGHVHPLFPAVTLNYEEFDCKFLDIRSPRTAFIYYGYNRFLEVGVNSKMILRFRNEKGKWCQKLAKIPFTKVNDRLEFDYPAYLKAARIPFRLYKKLMIFMTLVVQIIT